MFVQQFRRRGGGREACVHGRRARVELADDVADALPVREQAPRARPFLHAHAEVERPPLTLRLRVRAWARAKERRALRRAEPCASSSVAVNSRGAVRIDAAVAPFYRDVGVAGRTQRSARGGRL